MGSVVVVAAAALAVSALTMFSGFGLGTLLLPVFALFFPVEVAVAATAVVHGANNVFKVALLGRHADRRVVWRFGLPAVAAAMVGAGLLGFVAHLAPLVRYTLLDREAVVTPVKLLLALLMVAFGLMELLPVFRTLQFNVKWLPLGGVLSGFFGGLSGHQGALRSAFLAKTGISTPAFVATNAVIGLLVDLVRIAVYGVLVFSPAWGTLTAGREGVLILTGILAAFAGVLLGRRVLHKVTMTGVQVLTGILLIGIALGLGSGLI